MPIIEQPSDDTDAVAEAIANLERAMAPTLLRATRQIRDTATLTAWYEWAHALTQVLEAAKGVPVDRSDDYNFGMLDRLETHRDVLARRGRASD